VNASFSPPADAGAGDRSPADFPAHPLERLYRAQAARLRGYFRRRAGNDDIADLVQETFARFAGAEQAELECPEAYLTRVASNLLRDRARAAANNALYLQEQAETGPSRWVDPHPLLESRDMIRGVEQALAHLPPRRRTIFLLHRLEDMTYAEIGEAVGMSEKGVKKQMAKALVELRKAVAPLW